MTHVAAAVASGIAGFAVTPFFFVITLIALLLWAASLIGWAFS